MGRFLAILLFLNSRAHGYQLVNAGKDFRNFAAKYSQASSLNGKLHAWSEFEAKYPDIYNEIIFTKARTSRLNKSDLLVEYFNKFPAYENAMNSIFTSADSILQKHVEAFKKHLPNFNNDFKVYFIPSLFFFNGLVTDLSSEKNEVLLIGVDTLAKAEYNLEVLFSHEIFHMNHFNEIRQITTWKSPQTPLWAEGLAVYYSKIANPSASMTELLMDDDLQSACENPAYLARIAKDYLSALSVLYTSETFEQFRKVWFTRQGNELPFRPGYCLGLRVVEEIAKTSSLQEMVSWGEAITDNKVKKVLIKFSDNSR